MTRKQIKIRIDKDGNTHLEGINFPGTECDKAMAQIERALGAVSERRNKPEYNSTTRTTTVGSGS